jgi:hypothetical protein
VSKVFKVSKVSKVPGYSTEITALLVLRRIGMPGEAPVQTLQICLLELAQIVMVLQGLGPYGKACSGLFWGGVRWVEILGSMCSLRF